MKIQKCSRKIFLRNFQFQKIIFLAIPSIKAYKTHTSMEKDVTKKMQEESFQYEMLLKRYRWEKVKNQEMSKNKKYFLGLFP